jgi:hypothetical protein
MTERRTKSKKAKANKPAMEIVADSPVLDEEKMVEDGFEKARARDSKGHYVQDDPNTVEDEAWEWKKPVEEVVETPIVEPEPVPTPIPEPVAVEPRKEPKVGLCTYANPKGEYIANSFKRKRAIRRGNR